MCRDLKTASTAESPGLSACMEQQMGAGAESADDGSGCCSGSESSFFLGGRLPAVWFCDDTDDDSNRSFDAVGKTSEKKEVKSILDGLSESPAASKDEELEPEADPTDATQSAPRFRPGEDYEVRGSPGFVLHQIGQCIPCLYHTRKADGCHKGDACDHCHLCTKREAKTRRNRIQLEAHKAQRRLARARAQVARASKDSDSQES
ncbi:unnamed protein product [Symbiodinium sp. CCMP2592]|nr:unnamed protein product [Symbiodinium sp. CCMP2592]